MLKTDAPGLIQSLNALADTFDKRHLTDEAAKIWFETLREFPNELVRGILNGWPKLHGKFPTPAEVWKIVNDIAIADRERAAAQLRAQAREPVMFARSEAGKRALAEIRTIIEKPRRSPRAHWEHILATHKPETVGHDYATAALKTLTRKGKAQREPGQDDEEREAA